MPPSEIYLVRHAEGYHNINEQSWIRDALLTPLGRAQCADLSRQFRQHDVVDVVMASPLRRTIQTAALSFGPTLARPDVPFLLIPGAQEVSGRECNHGYEREELREEVAEMFKGERLKFGLRKVDYGFVGEGWCSKEGYSDPNEEAVKARAADLRNWLFQRPEKVIMLVTHGAFLHYLTEQWEGFQPSAGTNYANCELRKFSFTRESTAEDAHFGEWSGRLVPQDVEVKKTASL